MGRADTYEVNDYAESYFPSILNDGSTLNNKEMKHYLNQEMSQSVSHNSINELKLSTLRNGTNTNNTKYY